MPSAAWARRFVPSKWNGVVTMPTVSAPSSLAMRATTGGTEALGQLASDVDLDRRIRERELLDVRVDGDELDVRDARIDHAVDRVQPRAADSDHADDGRVGARLRVRRAMQARRRLG